MAQPAGMGRVGRRARARLPEAAGPRNAEATKALKKRTLTNLYNAHPQWLADAHETLDAAVAAAYGWPAGIAAADALRNMLALNVSDG